MYPIGAVACAALSVSGGLIFACTTDPSVRRTHLPGPAVGTGLLTPNYPAHIMLDLVSGEPAAESYEGRVEREVCWLGTVFVAMPEPQQENPCFGMIFEVRESCPSPLLPKSPL